MTEQYRVIVARFCWAIRLRILFSSLCATQEPIKTINITRTSQQRKLLSFFRYILHPVAPWVRPVRPSPERGNDKASELRETVAGLVLSDPDTSGPQIFARLFEAL